MTTTNSTDAATDTVADACRFLEARVADGPDGVVPLADVAAAVGTSPDALRRAFVRTLGVTPRQYADTLRRERLRGALRTGTDVTGALFDAGYGSTSRLYESAHSHLGMTPASYRAGGAGATIAWTRHRLRPRPPARRRDRPGLCFIQLGDDDDDLEARLATSSPPRCSPATTTRSARSSTRCSSASPGDPTPTDIPLDITGTVFQRRVWEALRHIPYGEVRTYGDDRGRDRRRPRRCARSAPPAGPTPSGSSSPATAWCPRAAAWATTASARPARRCCSPGRARQFPGSPPSEDDAAATLDLD